MVAMVILPGVEVVMVILEPATKFDTPQPVPSEASNCPKTEGAALVPVPPLLIANVPVHPGTKVKVFDVVVEMLMVIFVSEVVATWTAGPVKPEKEVSAEVR